MAKAECVVCGAEFERRNPIYKTCGKGCSAENRRRCRAVSRPAYYAANREKLLEYKRVYRAANQQEAAEQQSAYRAANREKIAERQSAYRAANREKIAQINRAYHAANAEMIAKQKREHTVRLNRFRRIFETLAFLKEQDAHVDRHV